VKDDSRPQPDITQTVGFLGNLTRQVRLIWRLFNDRRVSGWLKLIPIAGLVYLISPIDLLPDFALPGLGQLDDLTAILLSLKMFVDLAPPEIVREHLQALIGRTGQTGVGQTGAAGTPSGPYIDVSYQVLGDEEKKKEQL
jgi:uncharacterized membrane protein YkvA (DUF1232 family)